MRSYACAAVFCVLPILASGSCATRPATEDSEPVTAILGAFYQEIALLKDRLDAPQERLIEGMRFVRGTLNGRPVTVAWTGVGKVNAAVVTALMIEHFKPERLIFTGIAGAVDPNLEPGDIIVAERSAHHDMGLLWEGGFDRGGVTNPISGDENPTFFEADEVLLATAEQASARVQWRPVETAQGQRLPQVRQGVIVTGDTFIASRTKCEELARELSADAVEMEGAAVAQVCFQQGVGCLVIRSISDKADEDAIADKQTFYGVASENSARLVVQIVELLAH